MTPAKFVASLSTTVVDENNSIYRSLLLNTAVDQAADPYWQRVLKLFGELSPEQREVLLELTRQVTIDAVANVLGIIDGTCGPSGEVSRFQLIHEGRDLGGDLQDLFLERAEHISP